MDDITKCKHWRWMPGMLTTDGQRVVVVDDDSDGHAHYRHWDGALHQVTAPPDLTDPATLGCLLHLVREAWGDDVAVTLVALPGQSRSKARWAVVEGQPETFGLALFRDLAATRHATEAEALVAALEWAP